MCHVLNTEAEGGQALKNNTSTEPQFCRNKAITFFLPCSRGWHPVKLMETKMKTQKVVTLLYITEQHSLKFSIPLN